MIHSTLFCFACLLGFAGFSAINVFWPTKKQDDLFQFKEKTSPLIFGSFYTHLPFINQFFSSTVMPPKADVKSDKLSAEAEKRRVQAAKAEAAILAVVVAPEDVKAIAAALALSEAQATRRLQENEGSVEKTLASFMEKGTVAQIPYGLL